MFCSRVPRFVWPCYVPVSRSVPEPGLEGRAVRDDPCSLRSGLRSQPSLSASALPWPWLPGSHRSRPGAGLVALETNVLPPQTGSLGHQPEYRPGNRGSAWEHVGRVAGATSGRAGTRWGDLREERWEIGLGEGKIRTWGSFQGDDSRNLGIGG